MTSNSEARKRHEERDSDTAVTPDDSEITITISRGDAKHFVDRLDHCAWSGCTNGLCIVERAILAALDAD